MLFRSAPALKGALIVFDCKIEQIVPSGTHDVFFCSVEGVRLGGGTRGLIYYARGYHVVGAPD